MAAWPKLIGEVGAGLGLKLSRVRPERVEPPDVLVVPIPAGYNWVADECDTPAARAKIGECLSALLRRPASIRFERPAEANPAAPAPAAAEPPPRNDEWASDPLVRQVVELLEARLMRVEVEEDGPAA